MSTFPRFDPMDPALPEARGFVKLHAKHMGFDERCIAKLFDRITTLKGEGPSSWVSVFSAEALDARVSGKPIKAANLFNLARFPVANSPAKVNAQRAAAQVFGEHIERIGKGERRLVDIDGHQVPVLFRAGRSPKAGLLILMGGIVSLKEQWGAFLNLGHKLGCAVVIADFAGVGCNSLPYNRSASRIYGAIMDSVADVCDVCQTMVIAPSFGGHLAMLHASVDQRIRQIITIGAPIQAFFERAAERDVDDIPLVTRIALAHAMGIDVQDLPEHLPALSIQPEELIRLQTPVLYIAAERDEIIPAAEWQKVAPRAPHFRLHSFDDVHGAPNNMHTMRLIILAMLLRHSGHALASRLLQFFLRLRFAVQPSLFHTFQK